MANIKANCKFCGKRKLKNELVKILLNYFCDYSHVIAHANKKVTSDKEKADKADLKKRKEAIKKRIGKNGYYDNYKTQLHRYIKHVLRKGEPCYTCNKPQSCNDAGGAFHVGHFIPQKEVDPRRFMLINLRIQCYKCNVRGSGMRVEYRQRLIDEIGLEYVEWLECDANHKSLKEQYPEVSDIKAETARYRKLTIK